MISKLTIDRVFGRANIVDVVSDYVDLKKSGVNYKGLCPFHQDHTPSFVVSPAKGIAHCFVCGHGGNAVKFVMEKEGYTFPEAIKKLAKKYNIEVEEDSEKRSEDELQTIQKRESMFIIYEAVTNFYRQQILKDTTQAKAALEYVNSRWNSRVVVTEKKKKEKKTFEDEDRDFTEIKQIGYAPDEWDSLVNFARSKGYDLKLMEEAGLIKVSSKGNLIDFYRNRIMIPITDKYGRVIAFTARTMQDDADTAKYINNKDSFMYTKGSTLFGLDIARNEAIHQNKIYCVEGAPDAMKLQSVRIENTVAALGTAWTKAHFQVLRRLFGKSNSNATICWIPDSDQKSGERLGPGFKAVMKNGKMAMEEGFRVTVKEIPQEKSGKKADADSYISSKAVLDELEEQDFPIWYADKILKKEDNTSDRTDKIKEICSIVILIDDEYTQNAFIEKLANKFGGKSVWRSAQKQAIKDRERAKIEAISKRGDALDILKNYGFYQENNCIYSNNGVQWSNFIMKPLFHIKDPYNSKRLYKLTNVNREETLIEMKEAEMFSLQNFRERVGSMGNFRWKSGPNELNSLDDYLYDKTDIAE